MAKAISVRKLTREDGKSFLIRHSKNIFEVLDTPISLSCWILLNEGEYEQLYDKSVNPNDYLDVGRFRRDYQAVSLLKKTIFDEGNDRSRKALTKFLDAEEQCRETNLNLKQRIRDNNMSHIFHVASRHASRILGILPDFSEKAFRYGPGATSAVNGDNVNVPSKLKREYIQGTRAAIPHIEKLLQKNPLVYSAKTGIYVEGPACVEKPRFEIVNYNTLTFVPKNGKIDRCICIEPDMNVPLQLAVGSYIRSRLKQAGLNIRTQQKTNAHFAKIGSLYGTYATLDLSSASDTIAISLVAELLPFEWFCYLSDLRSPFTRYKTLDGKESFLENEKFSSMGNGFTFELETLLFYSLMLAVQDCLQVGGSVMTYGDDIIVPTEMAAMSVSVLEVAGFTLNREKSYISGLFRESCGHDYFNGRNVRPLHLKEVPKFEVDKFKTANTIRDIAAADLDFANYANITFRGIWKRCVNDIQPSLRLFGPSEFGDSVIFSPRGEEANAFTLYGITRLRIAIFRPKLRSLSSHDDGVQRAAGLYGTGQFYPLRGRGYWSVQWTTCVHWDTCLGSWI